MHSCLTFSPPSVEEQSLVSIRHIHSSLVALILMANELGNACAIRVQGADHGFSQFRRLQHPSPRWRCATQAKDMSRVSWKTRRCEELCPLPGQLEEATNTHSDTGDNPPAVRRRRRRRDKDRSVEHGRRPRRPLTRSMNSTPLTICSADVRSLGLAQLRGLKRWALKKKNSRMHFLAKPCTLQERALWAYKSVAFKAKWSGRKPTSSQIRLDRVDRSSWVSRPELRMTTSKELTFGWLLFSNIDDGASRQRQSQHHCGDCTGTQLRVDG